MMIVPNYIPPEIKVIDYPLYIPSVPTVPKYVRVYTSLDSQSDGFAYHAAPRYYAWFNNTYKR
jgi:hypothetical protein